MAKSKLVEFLEEWGLSDKDIQNDPDLDSEWVELYNSYMKERPHIKQEERVLIEDKLIKEFEEKHDEDELKPDPEPESEPIPIRSQPEPEPQPIFTIDIEQLKEKIIACKSIEQLERLEKKCDGIPGLVQFIEDKKIELNKLPQKSAVVSTTPDEEKIFAYIDKAYEEGRPIYPGELAQFGLPKFKDGTIISNDEKIYILRKRFIFNVFDIAFMENENE
jgi:hypothetical protein